MDVLRVLQSSDIFDMAELLIYADMLSDLVNKW